MRRWGTPLNGWEKYSCTPMKRLPEKYFQGNNKVEPSTHIGSRSDGGRGAVLGIGMMLSELVNLVYYSTRMLVPGTRYLNNDATGGSACE